MSRILGIDYGLKRIGLAIGDSTLKLCSPLETIPAGREILEQVEDVVRIAAEYGAEIVVVGLPLNMDGTEGVQARRTRRFGDALAARLNQPVHYVDERLSSFAADEALGSTDLSRKKKKSVRDAVAAQIILQAYFDRENGD